MAKVKRKKDQMENQNGSPEPLVGEPGVYTSGLPPNGDLTGPALDNPPEPEEKPKRKYTKRAKIEEDGSEVSPELLKTGKFITNVGAGIIQAATGISEPDEEWRNHMGYLVARLYKKHLESGQWAAEHTLEVQAIIALLGWTGPALTVKTMEKFEEWRAKRNSSDLRSEAYRQDAPNASLSEVSG